MLNNNLEPADEYARVKANMALKYIQTYTAPEFAGIARAIVDIAAFLNAIPNRPGATLLVATEPAVVKPKSRKRTKSVPTLYSHTQWTSAEENALVEMRDAGKTQYEIAKATGRSIKSVACRISIMKKRAATPAGKYLAQQAAQ